MSDTSAAHPTLVRGADRAEAIDRLVALAGGRVGVAGVLADLGRTAPRISQQLTRLAVAFAWDEVDRRDKRWWPQGVTGSWDIEAAAIGSAGGGRADGEVLLTTAYAKPVRGVGLGSRITLYDVSDVERVRYDHVLLVRAEADPASGVRLEPVHAHAGGAAWVGRHLHVAATTTGVHTFDLGDIVPADAVAGTGLPDHGHRWVLPVRTTYRSQTPAGAAPLRFSFLSVTHETDRRLLVGEYGRGGMTTRLWTYPITGAGLLATGGEGVARPTFLPTRGVEQMQGAVLVDGALHVVTSRGRYRRGSIWTERHGRLVQHEFVLPPGPEDLSHRPSTDQLWTVTEYPHSRMIVAVDRSRFG